MAEGLDFVGLSGAFTGGLVLSFVIEWCLQPRPSFTRPPSAWGLHVGGWTFLFALEFALFRRPIFTSAMVLCGWLFLVLVSNAKWRALKEPFVASDFEYFADAFRHPRLYLPFFGWWRIALAALAVAVTVAAGLGFETPVAMLPQFWWTTMAMALVGMCLMIAGWVCCGEVRYEPADDLTRFGFAAFLLKYWRDEKKSRGLSPHAGLASHALPSTTVPAHIVVVQSESFFDARRWHQPIAADVLRNWDQAVAAAVAHGKLTVAAWGANTVRTEFAFLSGIANTALGVHRFNPYRRIAKMGISSVAKVLRDAGYRTVCIHPYAAGFYGRDRVIPALGFDTFIDIQQFAESDKQGPYVGDSAVATKILAEIGQGDQPVFVFAITMENHGPLHLENVVRGEAAQYLTAPLPAGCDDLVIYLRHLVNADRAVACLTKGLANRSRPGILAMFGDHVPSMDAVFAKLGAPEGYTDYLIWRSDEITAPVRAPTTLKVEDLAARILAAAGFAAASQK